MSPASSNLEAEFIFLDLRSEINGGKVELLGSERRWALNDPAPIPSLHCHPQQLQLLLSIFSKELPVGKPDFGPAAAGCHKYQPKPKGEFFQYRHLREEILLVVFRDLFPPMRTGFYNKYIIPLALHPQTYCSIPSPFFLNYT